MNDLSGLAEHEVTRPSAQGNDLLVKVKAVATNPVDFKKLANFGDTGAPFPKDQRILTVGWDTAGVVEAVGDDVSLFSVGDEVYFAGDWLRPGGFAEYTLVDERVVGHKPKSLSFAEAASLPLTGLTAWEAMIDHLHIAEDKAKNVGKVIFIIGGAGGVSTAAVNLAKSLGLTVIATGSRLESIQYVKDLGADYVVNHRENMTKQVHALGFQEVDYVFHTSHLTEALVTECIGLLKPFGGLACTDPAVTINAMEFFLKSISFHPELMFARPPLKNDEAKRQHDILTQMSRLVDNGVLVHRASTAMTFNLENLKKALELQISGKALGKIVLTMEA